MYKDEIIKGVDHNSLHTITSHPADAKARILILHGLHDHCGRYTHLADYFNERGFATVRYDMRGFGKSDGLRGYVEQFDDYINDLNTVVEHYLTNSDIPNFLFGHSMGALIGSLHILKYGNPYKGVVYSSGLFKVNEDLSPMLRKMSGVMSAILPKLRTLKLDANGLSRDPAVAQRTVTDELHYVGGVRARTGAEVINATAELQGELDKLNFPMLILHGEADPLTKHEASELLYNNSKSADKMLKIYPGAYHELINEINKDEVMQDVYSWILERLP